MLGGRVPRAIEAILGILQALAIAAHSGITPILILAGAIQVLERGKAGVHHQAIGATVAVCEAVASQAVDLAVVAVVAAMQVEAVAVMEDDKHFCIRLSS